MTSEAATSEAATAPAATSAAQESESLREALLELNDLRERESAALRGSNALLSGLEAMNSAGSPTDAVRALLASVRASFKGDCVAVLRAEGDALVAAHVDGAPTPPRLQRAAAALLSKPRHVVDLQQAAWWPVAAAGTPSPRSWLSAPLPMVDAAPAALVCLSASPNAFQRADRDLLARLGRLAAQALGSLALMERNQFLAAVIEGSTASFAIADTAQEGLPLVYVNQAFETLTGYGRREVLGRNCRFLTDEPSDAPQRARLREAVRRRAPGRFMLRNKRKDGRVFWNDLTLYPIGHAGDPQRFLVATQVDATDQRRAQTALLDRERLLRVRAVAMDNAEDAIAITDGAGDFTYMNPAHLAMFGYRSEDEVLGRPWSILYEPEMAERINAEAMPELQRSGSWRGEVRGRAKDGAAVMQEVSLTFIRDVGLICVTRDISARLRSEAERARLREQLHEAQRREALGLLAAGVAHDVNNVLTAIAGSAALLETRCSSDAKGHVRRIQDAADLAGDLASRLSSLGQKRAEARVVDLRGLLETASDLFASAMPPTVALSIDVPAAPVEATLDQTDMLQVISNLLLNARDALPGGAGRIEVRLRRGRGDALLRRGRGPQIGAVAADRAYAELSVADDGAGISAERLGSIFEPYVTSKGADGTGLGLSIVAHIVRGVDGALVVESAPGEGARFSVYWPMEAADRPRSNRGSADAALRDALVLLVDDDADAAARMADILERSGAEVALCTHPDDALGALREDAAAWSVLVTDFEMPAMRGDALARRARALRPDLPIVLCTGRPGLAAGVFFDRVVRKADGLGALLDAVRDLTAAPPAGAKETLS